MPVKTSGKKGRKKPARKSGAKRPRPLCVALTGPCGYIGELVLERLLRSDRVEKVVCLDSVRPVIESEKLLYYTVDLTNPTADVLIADILQREEVDVFVHCAFFSGPHRNTGYGHELMVIGTINVLNACAAKGIKSLEVLSTTLVYGAKRDNPNYLAEDHPMRGGRGYPYVRDRVEVENLLADFERRHPEIRVAVLRPCTVMGSDTRDFFAMYLKQGIVPTVFGYDPLFQFVHESDVAEAFHQAVFSKVRGQFNVVGEGVLPLSSAIKLLGNANLPVSMTAARMGANLLWSARVLKFSARHVDYLLFHLIADGARMQKVLGFRPRFNSREALSGIKGY